MMRSLYSGVSGLKTHQTKMDVIGNNIANVNTVAYKSQSITFSELMYQTTQKASGPNEATGTAGVNAKQIGLGVTSGAISTSITTAGSTQTTGNAFDLKLTGNSFFIVSDGSTNYFTRDGSFYVDAAGNLAMSSNGYNVMGWRAVTDPETDATTIQQDTVKPLRILSAENAVSPPQATTKAKISGILDRNDENVTSATGKAVNLSFYDNLGYSYTAKFTIKDTDEEGNYVLSLSDVVDGETNISVLDKYNATIFTGDDSTGTQTKVFKSTTVSLLDGYTISGGVITKTNADNTTTTINKGEDAYAQAFGYDTWEEFSQLCNFDDDGNVETMIADMITGSDTTYTVEGYVTTPGTAISLTYNSANGTFTGVNGSTTLKNFNLFLTPIDTTADNPFEKVNIDLKDSLNYNNEKTSTLSALSGDDDGYGTGCAIGNMTGVSIQNNGMIYGSYDNGQTKLLGQIAVANFSNASGLEKEGDNLYSATLNSGEFDGIGVDVTADGGYMSTGVLEMSNVDLSTEFTDLITTQRGFQANSRIITVSDTLLEELVNLKR
ncbi:MAG: flagellar hook protein FlgE [Lachnospiraceae bacterium]